MWSIGLAKTGNEIGLTAKEIDALPRDAFEVKLAKAYKKMWDCGAHYVVDSLADVLPCIDDINRRLAKGERP